MLKKNNSLVAAVCCMLLCTLITHAQEKLWGIQDGSVFQMNTDGSDKIQIYKEESLGNYGGSGLRKGTDGFLYGLTSDTHTFYRYDEVADTVISIFDSTEENKIDYLVDADGVVFFLTATGLFSVHSDGTNFRLLNTFENSGIVPLTITDGDDGWIYGTANRWPFSGAIWKMRKADGWFEKLHDLEFPSEGESRPTDRLFINSQGFLVGLLKAAARHSTKAFYRLKKDGSEFSYSESTLSNINSGIILHTSDNRIIFYGNVGYPQGLNAFFSADENGNNIRSLYTYPLETPAELTNIIELPNGKICGIGGRWGIGRRFITLEKDGSDYNEIGTSAAGPIVIGPNEKVYGIASNAVYNINTDGSDLNFLYEFGQSKLGGPTSLIVKGQNTIYGLNSSENIEGLLFKITDLGVSKVYDLSVDESNGYVTSLVEGTDGFIYGVGTAEWGTDDHIFRVHPDGTGFQSVQLHIPGFINGKLLKLSTGEIYGISEGGGSPRKGIIFKVRPNFTGVDIIYNFSDANGKVPLGALMEGADGFLYGTARTGGSTLYGVIFKVLPNGQQYIKLHEFDNKNGRFPNGGLVQDHNGYLYGVTPEGGQYKKGVLYRIKPDGADYTVLYHFDGTIASSPFGQLVIDNDNFLYGTSDPGIVYRIKNDGTEFSKVLEGGEPRLYFSTPPFESTVQVTNPGNGSSGLPINPVLKVTKVDNAFNYTLQISELNSFDSVSISLENSTNIFPITNLKYSTTYFARAKSSISPGYGPTTSFTTVTPLEPSIWGIDGNVVFHMEPDGSGFEHSFMFKPSFTEDPSYDKLYEYSEIGYDPTFITVADQAIFGIQSTGTNSDWGSIFKMDVTGISLIHVLSLDQSTRASLVNAGNGYIYGIGCAEDCWGTNIYRFNLNGSQFEERSINQYALTTQSPLIATRNHEVFGMSGGGGSFSRGFIFKVRPDISGIDIIYSFSGSDGKAPTTKLAEGDDGFLYGMTTTGGAGTGVIFKVSTDGSQFTILHQFTSRKVIGANPIGNLVWGDDGFLYGVCEGSGQYKKGMIFKLGKDGSEYSILYSFDGNSAKNPTGDLVLNDGYLYGSADSQLFRVKTDGTSFTLLHSVSPDGSQLFFSMSTSFQPDIALTNPGDQSDKGYSFFAATAGPVVPYALGYTIEISKEPNFSTLAFSGSSESNGFLAELPIVNVYNLEYNTTYYARARSSLWPNFGPVTSFTTLPETPRLFGVTRSGGPSHFAFGDGGGSIFSIEPDGSNFIKNRDYPWWSEETGKIVILSGDLVPSEDHGFYGASSGFVESGGVLFKFDLKGNFEIVSQDLNVDGSTSMVLASDHNAYVLSNQYDDQNNNTFNRLLKINTEDSFPVTPTTFLDFEGSFGFPAQSPLDLGNGYLYGVNIGDSYGNGVLYKVNLAEPAFEVVHNFTKPTQTKIIDGKDGFLYGAYDEAGSSGLYKLRPDGADYESIYDLPDSIGNIYKFVLSRDTLYGITYTGAFFKVSKSGEEFYTNTITSNSPSFIGDFWGELTSDEKGYLYGMIGCCSNGLGYIFRISTKGSDFTILHHFTSETGGQTFGSLVYVDPETFGTAKKTMGKGIANREMKPPTTERQEIIRIHPNPFKTNIVVEKIEQGSSPCAITIMDLNGKVVEEEILSKRTRCIMGENLATGFYLMKAVQENRISFLRVVKR